MVPDHLLFATDFIRLNMLMPMTGRFASEGLAFLSSTCGFPVAGSIGAFNQTIVPQSPVPQWLMRIFASPACVSQMPEGSLADSAQTWPIPKKKAAIANSSLDLDIDASSVGRCQNRGSWLNKYHLPDGPSRRIDRDFGFGFTDGSPGCRSHASFATKRR